MEQQIQSQAGQAEQVQQADPRGPFLAGDRALWIIVAILAALSLLVVYSATASLAWKKHDGDMTHYIFNQIVFLMLAFAAIYVVHRTKYKVYYHLAPIVYVISLLMMGATFFMGVNLNDAQRWLRIPFLGVTVQPSDLLRITTVMILARQLAIRQGNILKMKLLPRLLHWGGRHGAQNREILVSTTIPLLLPVALSCGMIFFSNLSTSVITFTTCLVMLFIGRVSVREIVRLVVVTLAAMTLVVGVMYAGNIGRSHTWVNRIKDFMPKTEKVERGQDVDKKPGTDQTQVENAKIAVATGGLFGKGPGKSTQRAKLPNSFSDFAFAFIVEEYGFFAAFAVMLLYLWIFVRSIRIFRQCGTAFPALLVLGLGLMIVLQALVNMLVSVHLMPVTGQTLPLVSLGGSSLVFTAIALGMMLGVSRQAQERTLEQPKGESILEK